jgi:PAS domain S-box-containing protein
VASRKKTAQARPKPWILRQRAEAILAERRQDSADMPVADLHRLMYELQVHQIELDMQNEELRQAQVALKAAYERYANLYDFAPVGYLCLDADGVILETNLTATQLLGVPRTHMIGHRLTDWVAPEMQDTIHRHRLQVFAEPTTHTCHLCMQRQDGTPFYAQLKSLARREVEEASLHWYLVLIDQTALRQAEEQFAWNAAIVDNLRDAIISTTPDGTIVSWNAGAKRLYGYRAPEVIGHSIDLLAPPEHAHEPSCLLAVMQRGERVELFEAQHLTQDGTRLDVSLTLSPIHTRNGAVIGVSVLVRNITLRKQREAKFLDTERALRQSRAQLQRLARRQQQIQEYERACMALEIHDEVAQLLTILQIDIAWLMDQCPVSPEMHMRLHNMSAQVDSLDQAVHRIATELRPRLLDDLGLLAAIEWQLEEVQRRTGLTYTLQVPPEADMRLDDNPTTALFRIFQEALTNVVRHAEASRVEVWVHQDAEGVCLEIIDNGKGFTVTPQSQRNALGLLGMHERAYLWGGDVTIEAQPGSGTTVTVRMPYRAAEDAEASP